MSNYKPIDLSKEDFRKYLDRQGVLDAVTKVLVKCNTERPEHALDFVVDTLNETHGNLKTQLLDAHQEIERLKKELGALKVEDKTVNPAAVSSVTVVKQDAEIDATAATNGGVEMPAGNDDSVGEAAACAEVIAKQDRDTAVPSTTAELPVPKETPPASSSQEEVQENAVSPATAASPNDAPDAKEPNASESSK
ncbi:c-Myc-binding protein homolog [Anopheles marshallii]|uniref:c-Myc-binding protein homolog n=1 Tax=Anopheles marshallii TaxID=1521116 RepID=UPI00237A21FB|nr:c-Myc-binding protein homolog [Anopheles marshallii]